MSNALWKAKWKRNDIAFHQSVINPLLKTFLPNLGLSAGDSILVPMCGKSLDMDWLTLSGLHVIGVEISNIAIQDFFEARQLKPQQKKHGAFTRWWHGDIDIWCGDIFDLKLSQMRGVSSLYDCASLTALPPAGRVAYVQHFLKVLPIKSQILLMTTESPDELQFDSASCIDSEVQALYEKHYRISLLHGKTRIKIDPEYPLEPARPMQEKVYLLNALGRSCLPDRN